MVKCEFCKGQLVNWTPGSDAMIEHLEKFPECPFVRGKFCPLM